MSAKKRRRRNNGSVNVVEIVVVAVLVLLIAVMLFLYFSFSKSGSAPSIFGYTIYQTKAVNMAPEVPANTAIIAKASEIENIKVGSAILCKIGDDTILTRVVQIVSEYGEVSYVVRFDTAAENDTFLIPRENVIAKAIWYSSGLGSLLTFVTSTFGIMLVIIIPSFIIILIQVVKIVNIKRMEEDSKSLDDLEDIMDEADKGGFTISSPKVNTDVPETDVPVSPKRSAPLFSYDDAGNTKNDTAPKSVKPAVRTEQTANPVQPQPQRQPRRVRDIGESAVIAEDFGSSFEELKNNSLSSLGESKMNFSFTGALPSGSGKSADLTPADSAYEDEDVTESVSFPAEEDISSDSEKTNKRENNLDAITELMSMIDAEETKLNK